MPQSILDIARIVNSEKWGFKKAKCYFSFSFSFVVKSTQQTCMHDCERAVENEHLHMNKNNKNTKAKFQTPNTLSVPKTRTE